MRIMTFTITVEDDQEVPALGDVFDVSNDAWTFFDATLDSVDDVPDDGQA